MSRILAVFALVGLAVGCNGANPTAAAGGAGPAGDNPRAALDWPQFRGPAGMGVAAGKLPVTWGANDNIAWKVAPGPGGSTPIVVGDRIYLTSYSGFNVPGQRGGSMNALKLHLHCLARKDGKTIWSKTVTPRLPEQDNIREGHGYASSTPAADHERLYVFFGKTGVLAFDFDGNQLWQTSVGNTLHGWGSAASPVLFNDLVIVNASVESESLVALDKKTGQERWRAGGIKEAWNTPLLLPMAGGKTELIVPIQGKILAFDPTNGQPLWNCGTDIGWYMVPCVVASEGVIYCIGGRTGGGLAVRAGGKGDVTRSHRVWTGKKGSNVSSPVFHEGHLYWMHENLGIAYCAEAATGRIVYEERVANAGQTYSAALLADGKLYYVARNGRTFVVAALPRYQLLATNDLSDRSMFNASPAAAGDQLLIRSDAFLYCIGK